MSQGPLPATVVPTELELLEPPLDTALLELPTELDVLEAPLEPEVLVVPELPETAMELELPEPAFAPELVPLDPDDAPGPFVPSEPDEQATKTTAGNHRMCRCNFTFVRLPTGRGWTAPYRTGSGVWRLNPSSPCEGEERKAQRRSVEGRASLDGFLRSGILD